MTLDLHCMSFSPYSEKARWALDHHRVAYQKHEHVPMLGEVALRMRARTWRGKVSVPLAVEGNTILRDSFAIARHAERIGGGAPLFADEASVAAWDVRSGLALDAARVLLLGRTLADREALRDSLPPWLPGPLRGASTPVAASATRFLARKYGAGEVGDAGAMGIVRDALTAVRAALGGRTTLLGGFSYADIAMAVVLQMVSPVDDRYIELGPSRRRAWTEPTLAREFADLVSWRDALYERYRLPAS